MITSKPSALADRSLGGTPDRRHTDSTIKSKATAQPTTNRSRSTITNGRKSKQKRFHFMKPDRIFQHFQPSAQNSPEARRGTQINELGRSLDQAIGQLDDRMVSMMQKQENNFLTAFSGVMRQITVDLRYYKGELDKQTEEYKISERNQLRKQVAIFEQEFSELMKLSKRFEIENRHLKKEMMDLQLELRSEKSLSRSLGQKGIVHEKLASILLEQQTANSGVMGSFPSRPVSGTSRPRSAMQDVLQSWCKDFETKHHSKDDAVLLVSQQKKVQGNGAFSNGQSLKLKTSPSAHDYVSPDFNVKAERKAERPHTATVKMAATAPKLRAPKRSSNIEGSGLLRESVQVILQPRLRPSFSTAETTELLLSTFERFALGARLSARGSREASPEREYKNGAITERFCQGQSGSNDAHSKESLKSVVRDCIREVIHKSRAGSTHLRSAKSAAKNKKVDTELLDQKKIVEDFLKESEMEQLINDAFNLSDSQLKKASDVADMGSLTFNPDFPANEEDSHSPIATADPQQKIFKRRNTSDELSSVRQLNTADFPFHPPLKDSKTLRSKVQMKRLDLNRIETRTHADGLGSNRSDQQKDKHSQYDGSAPPSERTGAKGSQSERGKTKQIKLWTLLKPSEPHANPRDRGKESTDRSGRRELTHSGFQDKSPLTRRMVVTNGKLIVRGSSPAATHR